MDEYEIKPKTAYKILLRMLEAERDQLKRDSLTYALACIMQVNGDSGSW